MADWSNLPQELLMMVVVRLFSVIELIRFRSICTSWRSSVSVTDNPIPNRRLLTNIGDLVVTRSSTRKVNGRVHCCDHIPFFSRASLFRVTLSSSPDKGWLIKSYMDHNALKFHLVDPLSRFPLFPLEHSKQSIDLLEFTVTEIRESYVIHNLHLKRVVIFTVRGRDSRILTVGYDGRLRNWKGNAWSRLEDQMAVFSDIAVHKGLTYALDSTGAVWWINSSLSLIKYSPSFSGNITSGSRNDKNFVECFGELYIVDRLIEGNLPGQGYMKGFKVYKMDEELMRWVEVKNLGDNAILMAIDGCVSVSAHEYYGCMQNSIYFTENERDLKLFKLDDGSITPMGQSGFEMIVPGFL